MLYISRVLGEEVLRVRRAIQCWVLHIGGVVVALLLVETLRLDRVLRVAALRLRRAMWNEIKRAYQSVAFRALLVGGIAVALVLAVTLYLGRSANLH
jgi:hypothetical protein